MKVIAEPRQAQGTGASRRLRRSDKVPGIIYGGSTAPTMIQIDHNNLYHALRKEQFHSTILDLELGQDSLQVLLRDYQMHPYKKQVMHIDFQRVAADQRITMKVPLHFTNEENSPAIKRDKCLISHLLNQITVTCLPAQLPEFITVDLGEISKGQAVHVADLKLPEGVTAITKAGENPPVVTVVSQGADEPEASATATTAEAAPAKTAAPAKAAPAKADDKAKPAAKAAPAADKGKAKK